MVKEFGHDSLTKHGHDVWLYAVVILLWDMLCERELHRPLLKINVPVKRKKREEEEGEMEEDDHSQ
jgi:hypothetical protein